MATRITALFPPFHSQSVGGIPVTASLAWNAIRAHCTSHHLECASVQVAVTPTDIRIEDDFTRVLRGRIGTVAALALARPRTETLLVWHLDLLKLAYLFRYSEIVLFLHGIEAWRRRGFAARWLMKHPKVRVLSNTQHTLDTARAINPELTATSARIVHLGVGSPANAIQTPGEASAVMIGRLDREEAYKGHHEVIRAWPNVLRTIPNARLHIVGDGTLKQDLIALAQQLNVFDSIVFHGVVSDARRNELIESSMCLALPSRGEGFGLVYLEAMRAGRPCLVSTVDAGREVVDPPNCGLAVNPDDTIATSDALIRLLTDGSQWNGWSRAAKTRYDANFTAQHFQDRLIDAVFH